MIWIFLIWSIWSTASSFYWYYQDKAHKLEIQNLNSVISRANHQIRLAHDALTRLQKQIEAERRKFKETVKKFTQYQRK